MSKSLLRSTGIVGALTLVSRILGFVRDVMFAATFGAGTQMDAFLVALQIPNLGRRMFAEGAFSQAFVPVLSRTKARRGDNSERELIAVVSGTLAGVLAVITLVGCLAAPLLVWVFAPGFGDEPGKSALAAGLLRWTFPYLLFISLTAMASGILNTHGQFAIPAATPILLNICLIGSAFIDNDSVQILAYSVFVAGVVQLAFQLPSLARLDMLPWPRWGWHDRRVRRIVLLMLPIIFSSSVAQISLLLNTALASFLDEGAVTWLYNADRLMEFPLGVFSIAIATVILPSLSSQHGSASPEAFSATLHWALRMVLLIGLPCAMGLFFLAGPLLTTLYQYGQYTAYDVDMARWALMAYAIGFMGFSMVKVLVPGFYARQETKTPVRIGITALSAGMVMSLIFVGIAKLTDFEAPHAGLAMSTSLGSIVNALLLFRRLRKDEVLRPFPGWRGFLARLAAANLLMIATVLLLHGQNEAWTQAALHERALRLGLIIGLAAAVYGGSLLLMGLRPRHLRSQVVTGR